MDRKYYRITEKIPNPGSFHNGNTSIAADNQLVELTEAQFLYETENYEKEVRIMKTSESKNASEDEVSTSWISVTTRLSYANVGRWALSSEVSLHGSVGSNSTDVIGLGINSQTSIVAGSEYLHRHYAETDSHTGEATIIDEYPTVQIKTSSGYAAYYKVTPKMETQTVYYLLAVRTNNSGATVVDGYGHYARKSQSVTPSVSFGSGGASISITPSSNWSYAPATHVQLEV